MAEGAGRLFKGRRRSISRRFARKREVSGEGADLERTCRPRAEGSSPRSNEPARRRPGVVRRDAARRRVAPAPGDCRGALFWGRVCNISPRGRGWRAARHSERTSDAYRIHTRRPLSASRTSHLATRARDRTLPRARITPSWTRRWSSCPPSPPLPPRSRRARPRTSEAPPPIEIASTRESARLSAVTASPPRRARSRWRPSATLSRLSRNPTAPPRPAARRCSWSASRRDATRRSGRDSSPSSRIMRDGVAQRNYGNGGSWPEAAEARRRGRCPRCDADTSEAAARAEREGIKVDPMGDPVEQARFGQHPLGWCESCAEGEQAPRRQRRVLILNEAEDDRESRSGGGGRARDGEGDGAEADGYPSARSAQLCAGSRIADRTDRRSNLDR